MRAVATAGAGLVRGRPDRAATGGQRRGVEARPGVQAARRAGAPVARRAGAQVAQ